MIIARKNSWFESAFAVYTRNLLSRRFEGLRVAGLGHLRTVDAPLVLYANHSSWWDGLIIFTVGRACALDQYVMMEEQQLLQYPLFRRLGAFSVVRERPREAARSIAYASILLRRPPRAVWMFPQGVTLPNDTRPLRFYPGVAHLLARAGGAYAAPVAIRYEFLDDFRPESLVRIGPPEQIAWGAGVGAGAVAQRLAETLTRTLDEVRRDVLEARYADYEEIVAPRRRERMNKSRAAPSAG